mmetsp:Transcript_36927/g.80141  ORF Transcript_36927/g.80141 Transcript_36927/m.80141 type:complete len:263 (-) Transcript_36927:488-1276(-)
MEVDRMGVRIARGFCEVFGTKRNAFEGKTLIEGKARHFVGQPGSKTFPFRTKPSTPVNGFILSDITQEFAFHPSDRFVQAAHHGAIPAKYKDFLDIANPSTNQIEHTLDILVIHPLAVPDLEDSSCVSRVKFLPCELRHKKIDPAAVSCDPSGCARCGTHHQHLSQLLLISEVLGKVGDRVEDIRIGDPLVNIDQDNGFASQFGLCFNESPCHSVLVGDPEDRSDGHSRWRIILQRNFKHSVVPIQHVTDQLGFASLAIPSY